MIMRALCLLLLLPASMASAQQPQRVLHRDLESVAVDLVVPVRAKESATREVTWQQPVEKHDVRYLRLQLAEFQGDADADIELRILREPLGEPMASYRWKDLVTAGPDGVLTGLLPAGAYRLQLVQGRTRSAGSFKLAKMHWKTPRTTLEAQSAGVRRDRPLAAFPATHAVHQWAPSVAMLHIGPAAVTCTGFLVGPDLLATNHHCIVMSLQFLMSEGGSPRACSDVLVEFDYLKNEPGRTTTCVTVEKAHEGNDFALLRLASLPKRADGQERRPLALGTAASDARLSLLHHPSGMPLAIEMPCNAQGVEAGDLLHDCQTIPGSSGSALFTDNGTAVAIHYKGAYPPDWTLQQIYDDWKNGPRYNRAKPATLLQP